VPRTNLWSHSVPRVELDHRSREASLRLEQIKRLFKPPVRVGTLRLNFCRVGEARRARRGARLVTQELSRQA